MPSPSGIYLKIHFLKTGMHTKKYALPGRKCTSNKGEERIKMVSNQVNKMQSETKKPTTQGANLKTHLLMT